MSQTDPMGPPCKCVKDKAKCRGIAGKAKKQ